MNIRGRLPQRGGIDPEERRRSPPGQVALAADYDARRENILGHVPRAARDALAAEVKACVETIAAYLRERITKACLPSVCRYIAESSELTVQPSGCR